MKKLIDRFLDYLKAERGVSPHTLKAYAGDLHEFHEFLNKDPKDIDNLDIRSFLASLHHKKLKKTSISRKLATVRSFFKYLHREGHVSKNPARLVSTPKIPKPLPRFLTVDEAFCLMERPGGTPSDRPGTRQFLNFSTLQD